MLLEQIADLGGYGPLALLPSIGWWSGDRGGLWRRLAGQMCRRFSSSRFES